MTNQAAANFSAALGTFCGPNSPYPNAIKTVEEFCRELVIFPVKTREFDLRGPFSDDQYENSRESQRRLAELQNHWSKLKEAYWRSATDKFEREYRRYIVNVVLRSYDGYHMTSLEGASEAAKKVRETTPLKFAEYRKQQEELERSNLPAPIKKLIGLVNRGIVTERGMNLATCTIDKTGKKLFELEGVDCRTRWILDCLADKFTKQNDYEVLKNKEDGPLVLAGDVEYFKAANIMTILASNNAPTIGISESEIRCMLGLGGNFPNWKIRNIIFGCRKAAVTGKIPLLYENGRRVVVNTWGTVFSDIIEIEDGVLLTRKGIDPQRAIKRSYIFCFGNVSGLIFISNLLQKKFTVLPKEFYRLPDAGQNIYRYLSNFRRPSHFGIKQLADIAGYREKDITQLRLRLNKTLNTLHKEGFIEHWEKGKGGGRKTTYHIIHSSRALLKAHSCNT